MGCGCDGERLAKGAHAAAWPGIQCDFPEGSRRLEVEPNAALLLGLGGNAEVESQRFLPLHPVNQSAVWLTRGDYDVAGGRTRCGLCQTSASWRGHSSCGSRLGA